jgi:hypothetical protein
MYTLEIDESEQAHTPPPRGPPRGQEQDSETESRDAASESEGFGR